MKNKINWIFTLIIALLALTSADALRAETIYGVTVFRELITFDSANPGTIISNVTIAGLVDQFEGVRKIDFRPSTGELYLIGNAPGGIYRLYKVDPATGAATLINTITAPSGGSFGMNFDPGTDQIRIVSDTGQNLRYSPIDGSIVATDTPLAYAAGDPNAGGPPPAIATCTYSSSSGLFEVDRARGILVLQHPQNAGTLNTLGPLNIPPTNYIDGVNLEFSPDPNVVQLYLAMSDPGASPSTLLYYVNTATGAATLLGPVGPSSTVLNSISIAPPAPTPAANADLKVTVSDSPDQVQNNGDITYHFFVSNIGPDTAKGVQAKVSAQNATFVSTSRPSVHSSQGEYTIDLPDIPANGTLIDFTVVFNAHQPAQDPSAIVTLGYSVSSNANDPIRSNDTDTTTTSFAVPPSAPAPDALTITLLKVNESFDPTPNVADTVLRFAAFQGAKPAGLSMRVQQCVGQCTSASDEPNWSDLADGGQMALDIRSYDPTDTSFTYEVYALNTNQYSRSANVYFRTIAYAPGYPDSISNKVGPFDLRTTKQDLSPTVFRIAGLDRPIGILPGQNIPFLAVQRVNPNGISVRVQTSTSPRDESSWTDLPGGAMTTACTSDVDPNFCRQDGTTNFYHVRSTAYQSGNVYFRAISSASGYIDSISKVLGPYNLVHDELPVMLLTPPTASAPSQARSGPGSNSSEAQSASTIVKVDAQDPDGSIDRVELIIDGKPFASDNTAPYEFDVQSLEPGHYKMYATGYDNAGGIGFSNFIGDFFRSPTGISKEFKRIADGSWTDPNGWSPGGVPGENDLVDLQEHHVVTLDGAAVQVKRLRISDATLKGPGTFFGRLNLEQHGFMENLTVNIPSGATFLVFTGGEPNGLTNVTVNNLGDFKVIGSGFSVNNGTTNNYGTLSYGDQLRLNAEGKGITANLGIVNNYAKLDATGALTKLIQLKQIAGQINAGTPMVAAGAGNLTAAQMVAAGAGNLVAAGGGNLVGNDGSSLIGQDGATLISNQIAGVVGNNGMGVMYGGPARSAYSNNMEWARAASSDPLIDLQGGTLTGTGVIDGTVQNASGYISVGNSTGALAINGDYSQGPAGSLLFDFSGATGQANGYDLLRISGNASLAGTLHIKPAPGTNPPGSTIVPLTYASATGVFDNVSANAQITIKPTGAVTSIDVTNPAPESGQPLNISTRMRIETGENVLIAGFIITGPSGSTKKVLIRGIGPSLANFGVAGTISDPKLELHTPTDTITNDNWGDLPNKNEIPAGFEPADSKECAIVATLSPGSYTAVVKGAHDTETGVGLAEVYDLETGSSAKLANISTRGFVGKDDNVMIGGFIVGGTEPAKVLVRATGPTLGSFGVQGVLGDPTLELHDSNGASIGNDNWRSTQETEITATTIPPANDLEPAILATLTPGNYTAVVRGKDNTTGVAVVEAYNLQ